jgi:hypothetical protein
MNNVNHVIFTWDKEQTRTTERKKQKHIYKKFDMWQITVISEDDEFSMVNV